MLKYDLAVGVMCVKSYRTSGWKCCPHDLVVIAYVHAWLEYAFAALKVLNILLLK